MLRLKATTYNLAALFSETTMKIPDDLLEQVDASVRQYLLDALPYDKADVAVVAHLHAMDATDLLITWFNWTRRMISVHPRLVHLSREFIANPLRRRYEPALLQLLTDIERGIDLRKYLSRDIARIATPPAVRPVKRRRRRRPEVDPMLASWGIHHLHMSKVVEPDGFVSRSEHLLFAVFRRGHAFVTDIMPHSGAWAKESTIRIILSNWPQAQLVHKLEGVVGPLRPISDDKRAILMQKHVNSGVEIDGAVYIPDGGITSSGVPMSAVRSADCTMLAIEDFVSRVHAERAWLPYLMHQRGIHIPDELYLSFYIDQDGFGLIEPQTKTMFRLHEPNTSKPIRTRLV